MKNINFVKTVTPQEHRNIAIWYRITLLLLTLTVVGMLIMHGIQLHAYYAAGKEQTRLASAAPSPEAVRNYQRLEQRKQELRAQLNELKTLAASMHNPLDHLTALNNALAKNATLQACTITHKRIDMIIACNSAQTAAQYISTVAKDQKTFGALQLTALQPNRGTGQMQFNATIKGMLA